jgi:PilZ domain-containing protein
MRDFTCQRCSSVYYTAAAINLTPLKCPYCGFVPGQTGHESRLDERSLFRGNCRLIKDDSGIPIETTDISRIGAGVVMKGAAPIRRDDTVRIEIEGFGLKSDARVVWVRQSGEGEWRAGLSFFSEMQV